MVTSTQPHHHDLVNCPDYFGGDCVTGSTVLDLTANIYTDLVGYSRICPRAEVDLIYGFKGVQTRQLQPSQPAILV